MAGSLTVLLCVLALVVVAHRVWASVRAAGVVLDPGVVYLLALALVYPLRILAVHLLDAEVGRELAGFSEPPMLLRTAMAVALGVGAFSLGYGTVYRSPEGLAVTASAPPLVGAYEWRAILAFEAISLVAKGVKVATGNYISFLLAERVDYSYANALEMLHMCGWVAFAGVCVAAAQGVIRKPSHLVVASGVALVELGYQVIQGSKTFLTLPFFIAATSYYLVRRRIPLLLAGVIAAWFVFVAFPFVTAFRDVVLEQYGGIPRFADLDIERTMGGAVDTAYGGPSAGLERADKAFIRFGGADELWRIMEVVPRQMPYEYGRDFLAVVVAVVPRAVWADKPIFSPGGRYGEFLGTPAAITLFPLGEMYLNWGWPGIALGMFAWGLALSWLTRQLGRWVTASPNGPLVTVIFVAELYWLSTTETTLPLMLATVVKKVLVYGAILVSLAKAFGPSGEGAPAAGFVASRSAYGWWGIPFQGVGRAKGRPREGPRE